MHLIVVRRDLSGFQHLHPEIDDSGTWRSPVRLASGGAWRMFADFSVDGIQKTLGIDVLADGEFRAEPLPAPATSTRVGELLVELGQLGGAHGSVLRFAITRGGAPVPLETYLGCRRSPRGAARR